ncbi:hypothetical protein [Prescottella sp. R16]|uniref:Scaffolding protein n=1 Tax=Nocardia thailandica TaxID=257275 RepID=A0ABW6PH71_9NOCA|nr:hypothetical protein [Prescottella sp. R16]
MSAPENPMSIPGPEGNADEASAVADNTGTPEVSQGLREARDRYRSERDASRDELTAAQARIARMQRSEIERLATEAGLSHGSDVFTLSGNDSVDYLDDDGNVDPALVAADVTAVLEERPGLRKNAPAFDPTQGTGGLPKRKREEPSLAAMIKGTVADPWSPQR